MLDSVALLGIVVSAVTKEGLLEYDEAENEAIRLVVEGDLCVLVFKSAMPCEVESMISVVASL